MPAIGKKLADTAYRHGVADRFPAPAVQKSLDVDLALLDHDDRLLRDRALASLTTATQHDANTLSLLRTGPGLGEILSLGRLDESHDIQSFPRGQDVGAYCRLVKCVKASAGQRYGTSGSKSGTAALKWAFSEAAVRLLRANPAGQQSLARLEKQPSTGKALPVLAHQGARAVSDR